MLLNLESEKVVILGLNNISLSLAKKLSVNKDVVILYHDIKVERRDVEEADVIIEKIDSTLISSLDRFSNSKRSIFISVTKNQEFNLLTAQLAKKLGADKTLAMVFERDYTDLEFNIDLIFNPYQIITEQINTKIMDTRLINVKNLIPGKINITNVLVKDNDSFSYLKVKEIDLNGGLIVAINRNKKMLLPDAKTEVLPDDYLYIMFKKGLNDWLNIFNLKRMSKRRLFILGGKDLGLYLINYWRKIFDPIIIIESSLEQCNILASKLEKPLILHGEGTELQLIKEEGINNSSIFLAASSDDLQNLLGSFGAKNLGCKTIVTLINEPVHQEIGTLLQLNSLLYIPEFITDYIINYIKNGQNLDKYILGNQIYTGKITLNKNSFALGKKIADLNMPPGIIIGVIIRKDGIIIPKGEDVLELEDKLVIFFEKKLESKINHIF